MNATLNFEAEPFEMESGSEEFVHEEASGDYEFSEGAAEDFEQEPAPTQSTQQTKLPLQSGQIQQALHHRHATNAKSVKTIAALSKYVVKRNGTYHFTLPARDVREVASKLGVDPRIASMLLKSLQKKNRRLRAAQVTQAELELEAPDCAGQSAVQSNWWGNQIWVNECGTKTLIKALQASGAAGGGCAAIVPEAHVKIACAAVGAISGISAYGIDAIDSSGGNQGIIVYQPWAGPPWVWHQ
jgi:hypothetical protein